jgi:hypothetical protein
MIIVNSVYTMHTMSLIRSAVAFSCLSHEILIKVSTDTSFGTGGRSNTNAPERRHSPLVSLAGNVTVREKVGHKRNSTSTQLGCMRYHTMDTHKW